MIIFNAEEMSVIRSLEEPNRKQLMSVMNMNRVPSERGGQPDELAEIVSGIFNKLSLVTDEEYAAVYAAAMEEDYAYGE